MRKLKSYQFFQPVIENSIISNIFFNFYIPVDCPPLKELVNGEFSRETSDEMMKWIFDFDFDIDDIPEEYLGDLIILVKLVRAGALKTFEADSVLQTIVAVKKRQVSKQLKCPEKINTRAVRVSYFYSKIYMVFHSCLAAVGIKHLQVRFIILLKHSLTFNHSQNELAFDNVHFQGNFAPTDGIFEHLKRIIS